MTDYGDIEKPGRGIPSLILCGGNSQRMGRDKAGLPMGSGTILEQVEERFARLSDRLVLVIGAESRPPDAASRFEVIRDLVAGQGPLEGLRTGLQYLRDEPVVFVGTCDAPLIVPEVYQMMAGELLRDDDAVIALPVIEGQVYPLTAVYRTRALETVESMLNQGQRRVKELMKRVPVREISRESMEQLDPPLHTIRNINTQKEYRELLQELESQQE